MKIKEFLRVSKQTACRFALNSGVQNKTVLELVRGNRGNLSLETAVKMLNKTRGRVSINDLLEELGSDIRYLFEADSFIDVASSDYANPKESTSELRARK